MQNVLCGHTLLSGMKHTRQDETLNSIFKYIHVFTNPCISHVFRRTCDHPRYLDEEEEHRKLVEQQQLIAEYKAFRASVEDWRRRDRQLRNHTKEKQILECEELQVGSVVEL